MGSLSASFRQFCSSFIVSFLVFSCLFLLSFIMFFMNFWFCIFPSHSGPACFSVVWHSGQVCGVLFANPYVVWRYRQCGQCDMYPMFCSDWSVLCDPLSISMYVLM